MKTSGTSGLGNQWTGGKGYAGATQEGGAGAAKLCPMQHFLFLVVMTLQHFTLFRVYSKYGARPSKVPVRNLPMRPMQPLQELA